jgi:hypothetical protein
MTIILYSYLIYLYTSIVKNPQEAVLDSKFLTASAEINAQKAKNITIGDEHEVNIDEFVGKVITASKDGTNHRDDECMDWEFLGKRASTFGKRAHTMDFLLGPLEVERKQVKRGKVSRLVKNKEDLVEPAKVKLIRSFRLATKSIIVATRRYSKARERNIQQCQ